MIPMTRQPVILTRKVPYGKSPPHWRTVNREMRKRRTLPAKPPVPTNNIDWSIPNPALRIENIM
jgi:hypothetical protein